MRRCPGQGLGTGPACGATTKRRSLRLVGRASFDFAQNREARPYTCDVYRRALVVRAQCVGSSAWSSTQLPTSLPSVVPSSVEKRKWMPAKTRAFFTSSSA